MILLQSLNKYPSHPVGALERGWIPKGNLNDPMINEACHREDSGEYKCVLKSGQLDSKIRSALGYIYNLQNTTKSDDAQAVLKLQGTDLFNAASPIVSDFFDQNRRSGVTCDFGGITVLIERNKTISDVDYNDDIFYTVVNEGPATWKLVSAGVGIALLAGLIGFVGAMRYNPGFNRRVRSTALFMPLTKSSNSLIRSSLNLPTLGSEYEELVKGLDDDDDDYRNIPRSHSTASTGPLSW